MVNTILQPEFSDCINKDNAKFSHSIFTRIVPKPNSFTCSLRFPTKVAVNSACLFPTCISREFAG